MTVAPMASPAAAGEELKEAAGQKNVSRHRLENIGQGTQRSELLWTPRPRRGHCQGCHSIHIPSPSLLEHLLNVEGGAAGWQSREGLAALEVPLEVLRRGVGFAVPRLRTSVSLHLQQGLSIGIAAVSRGSPRGSQSGRRRPGRKCLRLQAQCKPTDIDKARGRIEAEGRRKPRT